MIVVHCDGACLGSGRGGWAYRAQLPGGEILEASGHEPDTTNQRAELLAATRALEALPAGSRVRLVSDSQYVVRGVNEWRASWKRQGWQRKERKKLVPLANVELWQALDTAIARHASVALEWTKGHADDLGNLRVDELAQAAASGVVLEPSPAPAPVVCCPTCGQEVIVVDTARWTDAEGRTIYVPFAPEELGGMFPGEAWAVEAVYGLGDYGWWIGEGEPPCEPHNKAGVPEEDDPSEMLWFGPHDDRLVVFPDPAMRAEGQRPEEILVGRPGETPERYVPCHFRSSIHEGSFTHESRVLDLRFVGGPYDGERGNGEHDGDGDFGDVVVGQCSKSGLLPEECGDYDPNLYECGHRLVRLGTYRQQGNLLIWEPSE